MINSVAQLTPVYSFGLIHSSGPKPILRMKSKIAKESFNREGSRHDSSVKLTSLRGPR